MSHVALLGDSIFDNGAYTAGGPDVVTQLRHLLPSGWHASLLAIDGSMIEDLPDQVSRLPKAVTHLVVSIGGNNVLSMLDVLSARVRSTIEALARIRERVRGFEKEYRRALDELCALRLPVTLCTIYNGNFTGADAGALGLGGADVAVLQTALTPFNDVILRLAFEHRLNVIDLRAVCTEPADYANPIEPSSHGGEKISRAIIWALGLAAGAPESSRVFVG